MFFQGALHEKRDRPLRGVEAGVGIDAAGLHQVIHDQRRVGDAHAGVFDERQFALRALARIGGVDDLVGNAGDAQPGLELAAERADVRNSEHARKLEQLDGRMRGHRLGAEENAGKGLGVQHYVTTMCLQTIQAYAPLRLFRCVVAHLVEGFGERLRRGRPL